MPFSQQTSPVYDVLILGAGAAGLMAAVAASSRQKKVLLLEGQKVPGRKILISGGGRCNFTNRRVTATDYISTNPHFCKSALSQFTQDDFIRMVSEAEIDFHEKTLGQLFCDGSASEIVDFLCQKIQTSYCEMKTSSPVSSVQKVEDLFWVRAGEALFQARNLIVATGGLSYPSLGATDLGYRLARQFGHSVTELRPALDGFVFFEAEQALFSGLQGVSVEVVLTIRGQVFWENILFTHKGLSGPAALKASLFWRPGEEFYIDFIPKLKDFQAWVETQREEHPKKLLISILDFILPKRLGPVLLQRSGVENKPVTALSKKDALLLEKSLKCFALVPQKTVGYKRAEVTAGGVETSQISSKTMESKLVPGLYFVGEVLDVTGNLGGYNFQWAWSSGWVAGQSI